MRFCDKQQRPGRAKARGGFTLAEALIASTILAMVAATATLPFVAGLQQAEEAAIQEQGVALGEAMMEEVLARSFFEEDERIAAPGPDAGETSRDVFDNIDDFHGYTEETDGLRDFENAVVTDASLTGFWRQVSVAYVSFPEQVADDVNSFVHIQVRVYHGNRLIVTLDRMASRED